MSTLVLDIVAFREKFPAFSDQVKYPDDVVQMTYDTATCYVSDEDYGRLTGDCRLQALYAMTAHLLAISDMIQAGNAPGFVTSSSIGNVSVSVQPPPGTDQWSWWLNTTPYGQQLLALLDVASIGGFYIGGLPERSAFRKVGGTFY